ncbi:MAG: hypothetical protein GY945_13200 [Rhodobacteraceae bacterium]|nr:hypothetical protein [Paracoccaceae bacterium]
MLTKTIMMRIIAGGFVIASAGISGVIMKNGKAGAVQNASSTPRIEVGNVPAEATEAAFAGPVAPTEPVIGEEVARAAGYPILSLPATAPTMPTAPSAEAVTLASSGAQFAEPTHSGGQTTALVPTNTECEAGFTAMAAPGAMVDLTLEAPCYGGQMVEIFHSGMRFTERMDAAGLMQITVPAMEEDAFFNALFTDGRTESTDVLMLTVSDYQRVALFWKGEAGFELYALENGALYGEEGHVSSATPYGPDRGLSGQGGFLTRLGQSSSGYQVAVYSYPAMLTDTDPMPEISVEAEVLLGNCESEISATLLRSSDTGALETAPLFIAVPSCEAVGEYLVLKNLPQSQRIATN